MQMSRCLLTLREAFCARAFAFGSFWASPPRPPPLPHHSPLPDEAEGHSAPPFIFKVKDPVNTQTQHAALNQQQDGFQREKEKERGRKGGREGSARCFIINLKQLILWARNNTLTLLHSDRQRCIALCLLHSWQTRSTDHLLLVPGDTFHRTVLPTKHPTHFPPKHHRSVGESTPAFTFVAFSLLSLDLIEVYSIFCANYVTLQACRTHPAVSWWRITPSFPFSAPPQASWWAGSTRQGASPRTEPRW